MDLFRESMDSYRIVTTNPGFVSYRGSRILTLKDQWFDSHRLPKSNSKYFLKLYCTKQIHNTGIWKLWSRIKTNLLEVRIRSHDTVRIHGFAKQIHVFTNLLYESRILSILPLPLPLRIANLWLQISKCFQMRELI